MNNMNERLIVMQTELLAISTRLATVEETLMPTKNSELSIFLSDLENEFSNIAECLRYRLNPRYTSEIATLIQNIEACVKTVKAVKRKVTQVTHPTTAGC